VNLNEYLKILGLEPGRNYSAEELKKAWRIKCNEHHPDKGGDQEKFVEVMNAFKMLTDPSYREAAYRKDKRQGLHINITQHIRFEDCFFGKSYSIAYNQIELNGFGEALKKEQEDIVSVFIEIPPGTQRGIEMKFEKKGMKMGDVYGDMIVFIVPQPSPRFKMEGMNVFTEEKVPLETMLKGGEIQVQTMYGLKTTWVRPGTQPKDAIVIKNCGVVEKGDHIALPIPVFPNPTQLKSEDFWQGLDINWEEKPDPDKEFETAFERIIKRKL